MLQRGGEEMNKLVFKLGVFKLGVFICINVMVWMIYLIIWHFMPVWINITLLSATISYFLTHR